VVCSAAGFYEYASAITNPCFFHDVDCHANELLDFLLAIRPKCLPCEQWHKGNTLVFTKQDYYNPV
jgi:hypothetical protein